MVTISDAYISGYQVDAGVGRFVEQHRAIGVGSTDTNIISRGQYNIATAAGKRVRMKVSARVTYTANEFVANDVIRPWNLNPDYWVYGKYLTRLRCYVVPAQAFPAGHTPTRAEMLTGGSMGQSAVRVFNPTLARNETSTIRFPGDAFGTPVGSAPSGAETWYSEWDFPPPSDFSPNSKYWVMVMPVKAFKRDDGTIAIRQFSPMDGTTANATGRVVSFWTNRKQAAPVIVSPVEGDIISPGDFTLSISGRDGDRISPNNTPDSSGLNGCEIQIRQKPTSSNPNPAWGYMKVYQTTATPPVQDGWSILGSTVDRRLAAQLLFSSGLTVRAGGNAPVSASVRGHIPSGDWQIRVRTFDPGMPWNYLTSPGVRPVNGVAKAWTPNNYFNGLTSPWSTPVNISIPAQIPAPIPLSPANRIAVVENQPIEFTWKYRNTADPAKPQKARALRYRKKGDTDWTTIVDGLDTTQSYTFPDGLAAPFEYEWQVKTTDIEDEESDWSVIASFLVIPAPISGGVRPIPEETIDGGTIGCGKHRAYIYRRGGKVRVGELTGISYLDWERKRDDISTAKIIVSDWDVDCGELLKRLQTWAYEVVIYRDNGYSTERVWEGPLTLLTYEQDSVTIHAKDVIAYAYRRIIKQAMNDNVLGGTVTDRALRVFQNAFAPDDPNVLAYLTPIFNDDDARQYRATPAYSRTAFEEVDDMAANAGLDYTAVGRAILIWSTKHRIGTLQEFRDSDFGAPPIVSEYGMSMANFYSVSDGNGIHGEASRLGSDNEDDTYGLVEMLSSTWASDTVDGQGSFSSSGLQTVIQSFSDAAERSIADRFPPPVVVRVPDNTSLNPDAVVSIQQLVPGVLIPLRSTATLREVHGNQKLDSVKVVESGGNETISITMSPFSRDDAELTEEPAE